MSFGVGFAYAIVPGEEKDISVNLAFTWIRCDHPSCTNVITMGGYPLTSGVMRSLILLHNWTESVSKHWCLDHSEG